MDKLAILHQGITIGIIGILVVFGSLVFLLFFLKAFIAALRYYQIRQRARRIGIIISRSVDDGPISEEVVTAITMAIHRSRQELHDMEQTIITLNRITRPYSPWSSKIHGIRRPAR
ncbi:hypothetical protein JW960_21570 [candidate division KSB1 bacterium]|nr:hypothetical protein [candidate division KSB1 bacterium]